MIVEYRDSNDNRSIISNCTGFYTTDNNSIHIEIEGNKSKVLEFKHKDAMNQAYNDMVKSLEKWIKITKES